MTTETPEKKKRRRKEWVYKSEYDRLERRMKMVQWVAAAGWMAFVIVLKYLIG